VEYAACMREAKNKHRFVRIEFLTVVAMKVIVMWDVLPCSLVEVY
jgi:hypothetical protein